jgi:hypothetical protein
MLVLLGLNRPPERRVRPKPIPIPVKTGMLVLLGLNRPQKGPFLRDLIGDRDSESMKIAEPARASAQEEPHYVRLSSGLHHRKHHRILYVECLLHGTSLNLASNLRIVAFF